MMKKTSLITTLLLLLSSPAFALKLNDPAPTFSLRDSNGGNFYFSDYIGPKKKPGTKGIIISFFASWCEPCRRELPILNNLMPAPDHAAHPFRTMPPTCSGACRPLIPVACRPFLA